MDISSYVTVLPIVIICYLVGIGCKASKKISDKTIPVIVGIVGGIVAVPAMYVMKSFPAEDIITAISVGIMSGFAQLFLVVDNKNLCHSVLQFSAKVKQ